MAPKIAIVYYSMYGHIAQLAEAEKKGIEAAGGTVDVYQVTETLSDEVLSRMHAKPQDTSKHPHITPEQLTHYDAFLLGIPTRYGCQPAQWRTFWDRTGKQWTTGGFHGKLCGMFVSSGSQGGGQEETPISIVSTLVHHGIVIVPLGYKPAFPQLGNVDEVRGGGPWGAGTFAKADGSRQPTPLELELAEIQGKTFYEFAAKHQF